MRTVFIGCVEFSYMALQHLLTIEAAEVVGVATRRYSSFNDDFRSLAPLAEEAGVPCFFDEGNKQEAMGSWLRELAPDVVYCFGWSYLLGKKLLSVPEIGVVGYHPAALPRNRGRHPIIWALALGLEETASTFFFMDEGADSGDLLSQEPVPITKEDDASSLYERLADVAQEQMSAFTPALAEERHTRTPQDGAEANHWRKRGYADGQIDWRMSARSIYNLVRALTHPYAGAHCTVAGEDAKVWKAEVVSDDFADVRHLEPGKVLGTTASGEVAVKCGEGVIRLTKHDLAQQLEEGQYL